MAAAIMLAAVGRHEQWQQERLWKLQWWWWVPVPHIPKAADWATPTFAKLGRTHSQAQSLHHSGPGPRVAALACHRCGEGTERRRTVPRVHPWEGPGARCPGSHLNGAGPSRLPQGEHRGWAQRGRQRGALRWSWAQSGGGSQEHAGAPPSQAWLQPPKL